MPLLIDLSNHNGFPDFPLIKRFGVAGVFLKASEGTHFVDQTFQTRRAAAGKAGLHVGAYHFAQPDSSSAAGQADLFCGVVKAVGPTDMRPVLDLEVRSKLHPAQLVEWARVFNQEVKARLGTLPLFYSYGSYAADLHATRPIGAGLWLAAYGRNDGHEHPYTVPAPWRKAVAHQFTSTATVPGCSGPVDLSHAASMTPILAHPVKSLLPWLGRT